MKQRTALICESCARFRRLGGHYSTTRERGPHSPEALIPCKVGLCSIGGSCGVCSGCGKFHEGDGPGIGSVLFCECGLRVRLEPRRYVLPWSSCKQWIPASPSA